MLILIDIKTRKRLVGLNIPNIVNGVRLETMVLPFSAMQEQQGKGGWVTEPTWGVARPGRWYDSKYGN